jgi:hypothetical protein
MSDMAKRWVSPFWQTFAVKPGHTLSAGIWVANPGAVQAKVTVTWFSSNGSTVNSDQQTIPPKNSTFAPFAPCVSGTRLGQSRE